MPSLSPALADALKIPLSDADRKALELVSAGRIISTEQRASLFSLGLVKEGLGGLMLTDAAKLRLAARL